MHDGLEDDSVIGLGISQDSVEEIDSFDSRSHIRLDHLCPELMEGHSVRICQVARVQIPDEGLYRGYDSIQVVWRGSEVIWLRQLEQQGLEVTAEVGLQIPLGGENCAAHLIPRLLRFGEKTLLGLGKNGLLPVVLRLPEPALLDRAMDSLGGPGRMPRES